MNNENILDDLWKSRHEKEALFLEIIDGYEIMISKKYQSTLFYVKNGKILMYY